eukprot:CAMPEP_0176343048 /NCGR_PEP_ID=MMETSP0126-20121128/3647_1 /TAXON_ID=141414 ORGANISM="Strombidinopsis acuminatum, Strain SPMC142" /NCGR_SAMPLE_ID=MMETSP0126 /ASSEMBLY_ACC=CAM_ASM_000229 /LENGTH=104 /DNA_ID=CAMNT_0017688793 /DNA_START=245 /DNA_END=556 /DNA_ORIENTATION=-
MTPEEIDAQSNSLSWLVVNGYTDFESNEFELYVLSYYWVMEVITTVGYGDYSGKTMSEYGFSLVLEFVGLSFFSLLMGFMTYVFGSKTSFEDMIEDQMDNLDIW